MPELDESAQPVTPGPARSVGGSHAGRDKTYNRIKLRVTIADIILNFLLLAVFAFSGISPLIVSFLEKSFASPYTVFLLFMAAAGIVFSCAGFPLDFYSGYIVEHRYALSTQTLARWFLDRLKSSLVGISIGVPVALAFYHFLLLTGDNWWLYFGAFLVFVSVVLARVAPVLIFPLFYKFTELGEGEIKDAITRITSMQGLAFRGIYTFNMSKKTRKANAGFTGIGRTRRIILSDTLVENFSPREIAVIFAHEMGHYKKRHILKNLVLGAAIIFLSLRLCGYVYSATISAMGYGRIHDVAALPVLLLYLSLFSLAIMPMTNAISRRYEVQADTFALETTGDRESFITSMEKLAEQNLADRNPHPVEEFVFYSHPSIGRRVAFARGYKLPE